MMTSPNNGSFSNNLSFAQSQSNGLPSWLSFDRSTGNITSTDPETLGSDTYTITNTYTGVSGSSITFTTDLNITVIEYIASNTTVDNSTVDNTTVTNNTSSNSNNDEKHCFGRSSEAACGIVITAIVLGLLVPIIAITVLVYCKWNKARKRANRNNFQQVYNQDNAQHQSVQHADHQVVDIHDMVLETEAYQAPDNQL